VSVWGAILKSNRINNREKDLGPAIKYFPGVPRFKVTICSLLVNKCLRNEGLGHAFCQFDSALDQLMNPSMELVEYTT
jgi:hypothetical protein